MKIRWTEASVRFRITPTELEALLCGASVCVGLPLSGGWRAGLYPGRAESGLQIEAEELCFSLTETDIQRLASPDVEGVYFQQETPPLHYYIEKDFPCEHPRPFESAENTETFARVAP